MLLGLDVGGTKVAGVLLSDDGRLLESAWCPHEARNASEIVIILSELTRQLTQATPPAHLTAGISVAGLVGSDGLVTRHGALTLDREDIGRLLRDSTGLSMLVMNDADATLKAALAHDGGTPVRDAVLLALGTGVAGAVMWNGSLIRGRVGLAGELGHLPVLSPLSYRCVCGGAGCLEQYASGRGLTERARTQAAADEADDLIQFAGVAGTELTAVNVVDGARADIASAVLLIESAAEALAQALIGLAVTTEPAKVFLGGSLAHAAGDLLLPRLAMSLKARWPFPDTLPPPPVAIDNVGPHAGAVGAALLAGEANQSAAENVSPSMI